jgi:2-polyprenyl-6-methoxyphenol hydroxylase-like FAD-dependent oxidoreductase
MAGKHDVIILGARCAGSTVAMLLSRKGYRVLLVDRATFPSDTLSTHIVQPHGIAALERWGLLDRVIATGCPPIDKYCFDFEGIKITGRPGNNAHPVAYCPRRTILDKLLLDAAAESGADVYEGFAVTEIIKEDDRITGVVSRQKEGGRTVRRARIVIGADGRNSLVARTAQAEIYDQRSPLLMTCYAYWSGMEIKGRFESYWRRGCLVSTAPTHHGLTILMVSWPWQEHRKIDVEARYSEAIELIPEVKDRMKNAKQETRLSGVATPNLFRKPYGEGWALVGDAGYCRDPITAQGIKDAFLDAELCAGALDEYFSGTARSYSDAMSVYQQTRDQRVKEMYEMTCRAATLQHSTEFQRMLTAIQGDQSAMDRFIQMNAGTISIAEFWSPKLVRSFMRLGRMTG